MPVRVTWHAAGVRSTPHRQVWYTLGMSELDVLRAAHEETLRNVDGLTADDLTRPTPCADWDVRALLVHIVAATDGPVAMLRSQEPDWGKDQLGDDPAAAVRDSLAAATAAWAEPGALELPSRQMPGMRVVDFAVADAVTHGWDLATALGRPFALADDLVRPVLDRWDGDPAEQGRVFGVFGPRVEVAAQAPALDRLLGLFGRDPAFRPPSA